MSTPEEIKAWLKRIGKSREWLGEKCGVSKRSVDNWLSTGTPIPYAKWQTIERLMHESGDLPAPPPPPPAGTLDFSGVQIVAFPVTAQEMAEIEQAAELSGMTPQEFCRKAVVDYTAEVLAASEKGDAKGNGPSAC